MKIVIKKNSFIEDIKIPCEIAGNQFLINPNLANILLEVKDQFIVITSSNSKISIQSKLNKDIEIKEKGKILIKGNLLFNVLSKINTESITLETLDSSILRISSNNFSCDLNLQDENSYPLFDFDHSKWTKNTINLNFIKNIKSRAVKCVLQDEDQTNVLSGVLIDSSRVENQIEAIGTDSFHLVYIKDSYQGERFKFILTIEALNIIDQLSTNEKEINFYHQNNQLIVEIKNNLILCHLIEGNYPSAIKVIEERNQYNFKVDKTQLLNAIELANVLMSNNKKPSIFLKINKNELFVKSQSVEQGSSNESIKLIESNIDEITFCLNIKYLTNLIKNIKSTLIEFWFNSQNKPVILKEENNYNYLSLILPIRTL